jgi:hypothetical protein
MGTMSFRIPADLPCEAQRDLERACLASIGDTMPWPSEQILRDGLLTLRRSVDESGHLMLPWPLAEAGHFSGLSATLMEREAPYDLLTELVRGKLNQIRNQTADWQAAGLVLSEELGGRLDAARKQFVRLLYHDDRATALPVAQDALRLAYEAAAALVHSYISQVFHVREQREIRAETHLGCRLGLTPPTPERTAELSGLFTALTVPMPWTRIEPEQDHWNWEPIDQIVAWAEERDVALTAGPLVDFSSAQLPAWLWLWERDLPRIIAFVCRFVERAIRRYRGRIRRWHLTAASNFASILSLGEDELLGVTFRLAETARQIDAGLELLIGITQPWGDYMATNDHSYSPHSFADTLLRSELNLAALDLEIFPGVTPRGSFARDLLDVSRLLDMYAPLGVPLQLTLGYPASASPDEGADPDLRVGNGQWPGGFTPEGQADWTAQVLSLALCKPSVRAVQWTTLGDDEPHQIPHCGLYDAQGRPRSVLTALRNLRQRYIE